MQILNNQEFPEELKGWNWGAFLLNWIWGIRFNTFRALLIFIPLLNIVMMVILGLKGNEWAWRHNNWRSIEEFKSSQRNWARAGLIIMLVTVIPSLWFLWLLSDFLWLQ